MKLRRVRMLLGVLLVVAVVAALGWAFSEDPGYVLFAFKSFRYESSLWAFVVLLALLWLLRRLLRLLLISAGVINPWSNRNRQRRARLAAERGLLDLAEGHWARALRHLRRAAESDQRPLIHYLGAARAAQRLGQHEECDALLERALEVQPRAELAIALAHAELLRERGQLEQARTALEAMRERHPHQQQLLRQLQGLMAEQGDCSGLIGLLPELRKYRVLDDQQLLGLERAAWQQRLGATAADELAQAWQQVPSSLRQDPQMVAAHARRLCQTGAEDEAERVLRKALGQRYDSHLSELYGQIVGKDPARQLQTAEAWLREHPEDPRLMLALGRLSLRNQLWGKARDYLEGSLAMARSPEACAELGRLLARQGEVERSNQLFQEGMELLARRPSLPALRS